MGDHADDIINQILDNDGHGSYSTHTPKSVTCKFCGGTGLWWYEFKTGWRLVDSKSKQHICEHNNPFKELK